MWFIQVGSNRDSLNDELDKQYLLTIQQNPAAYIFQASGNSSFIMALLTLSTFYITDL